MNKGSLGFLSLLLVIGISIVFGVIVGGKLNAPPVAHAAPSHQPIQLAPANTGKVAGPDFADVVERSIPAVVGVTTTRVNERTELNGDEENPHGRGDPEEFLRRFFSQPTPEGDAEPSIGEGSGFIISTDGYVLTNHHVIQNSARIRVSLENGRAYDAEVVGSDPSIDLALLKIDAGDHYLPTLPLGDSDAMRVGEWVLAIGNPLDFEHTVTAGVVSAKGRRVPISGTDEGVARFIQTDAAINFGNSGGPLLDGAGNVIGINTAIRRSNFAEGIGFALPINHVRLVIDQLREYGEVRRGYIGIRMAAEGITEEVVDYFDLDTAEGVLIDEVVENGPADDAGLRRDDIVRKVNGVSIRDNSDLIWQISSIRPDETVKLDVLRDGKLRKLEVRLADRDEGLRAGNNRRPEPRRAEPEREFEGLGFAVRDLKDELRDGGVSGVTVSRVEVDSQAFEKGLRRGMVIISINGTQVDSVEEWQAIAESLEPGTSIRLGAVVNGSGFSIFLRVPD
ncbi:MAG: trypsin-like peptidase domain-containing protein [Acidobacteriota bacterium]|nr:trypsin-like peptidase domain-containing protein [Acidobacteriota bacterium]MDH3785742.1 trypsin-like peptidase domain-containing protein [Acidobacteriota bacterium]